LKFNKQLLNQIQLYRQEKQSIEVAIQLIKIFLVIVFQILITDLSW